MRSLVVDVRRYGFSLAVMHSSKREGCKPKILFVLPADVIGGAETWIFNVLRTLDSVGPVLLTQKAMAEVCTGLEMPVYWFDDYGCRSPYEYLIGNALAYARAIRRVIDQESPDVTLGLMHNGTAFIIVTMALFRPGCLMVGSILGSLTAYFESVQRMPSLYEKLLMRYGFRRLAGIITPSEGVRRELIDHYWAPPKRVKTIYNGFDLEDIRNKACESLPTLAKNCPWIVSSCRLSLEKDFDTLLEAFRIIRQQHRAKLIILGDGSLREAIINKSVMLGIREDLILLGFQSNPFPYVAQADIFVLSSFFEGFGNVIIEAMALGIPVVSSDCPYGPGEIIQDGVNGFLVPVRSPETMARQCKLLLENSRLRMKIITQSLQRAEDFKLKTKVLEFENYLQAL